jgi:PKHD-type hydroxylase
MLLKHSCWFFTSAIPHNICDDIIKHALHKKEQMAITGEYNNKKDFTEKDIQNLYTIRNSNIVWLNDKWIYDIIHPFVHMANKNAGWNFDWDFSEDCQFTIYKKDQHYSWHPDSSETPLVSENKNLNGKIRKLSVTLSLSDPNTYKGGELEFHARQNRHCDDYYTCDPIKPKGSIAVFPSFVWHRVKPVTEGTRHSLVVWNLGYPFK